MRFREVKKMGVVSYAASKIIRRIANQMSFRPVSLRRDLTGLSHSQRRVTE